MPKLTAKVTNIEQKVASNGKEYATVQTSMGTFSLFNMAMALQLEIDREYMIEYGQNGKYKNIIGFEPINKRAGDYAGASKQSDFAPLDEVMKSQLNSYPAKLGQLNAKKGEEMQKVEDTEEVRRTDCLNLVIDLIGNCPTVMDNVFLSNNNAELGVKIVQTADIFDYYLINGWDEKIREFRDSLGKENLDNAPEAALQADMAKPVTPEGEEQKPEQKKMGEV